MTHLMAVTLTLFIYLFLAASYCGWGQIGSFILKLENKNDRSLTMLIWFGWAITLFIFQVLHFFLPITAYTATPILFLGSIFSLSRIRNCDSFIKNWWHIILFLTVTVWIASRAMLPPTNGDSGLYHFNAIRWINTYPIVPGLGNLHDRLAFNQSFFTYVASLDFYPYFGHGRSLANSFLFLLLWATILPSLISTIKQPSLLITEHPLKNLSDLFLLPILIYLALFSNGLASPSPDLTSNILQMIMFRMLTHGIAEWIEGQRDQKSRAIVIVILAATAVTIKLSNLAFSAVIIGFALSYTWQMSHAHKVKSIIKILLPAFMLILVWGIRGFILSGAPLYPSTIGYIPVDWAMPIENIINEANWVFSWARLPGASPEKVLGNWNWLHPWLLDMISNNNKRMTVVYPLLLTTFFCSITIISTRLKKSRSLNYLEWGILLPPIIAMIYWFFTAPDPRFANSIFFLASLSSILLFISALQRMISDKKFIATICAVFLLGNTHLVVYLALRSNQIKVLSTSGWFTVQTVPLNKSITASGLIVYHPSKGDQCWDSDLPSTPYFNDQLKLRNPRNIASGFTLRGQQ